jgi:hypothetical protein
MWRIPRREVGGGAYQAIIAQMPPHHTYIETHFCRGAIFG